MMMMVMMMTTMVLSLMMMMSMGVGRYFGNVENATLQLSLEMLGIPKTPFLLFYIFFIPISSTDGAHDSDF